jgi:hypothetical protein
MPVFLDKRAFFLKNQLNYCLLIINSCKEQRISPVVLNLPEYISPAGFGVFDICLMVYYFIAENRQNYDKCGLQKSLTKTAINI